LDKKIKVGIVNYLNTKPFLHGIENNEIINQTELIKEYPSKIADDLISGKIDLGLVPVVVIPKMLEFEIITDFCIGCNGEVSTVCLFGEQPIEKLEKIYLDYQSRTSVQLLKILLKEYWKLNIELIDAKGEDFRDLIKGSTGGLVIGDRAFDQRNISAFQYDLGQAWKKMTGLPFVFAVWVANKKLPVEYIHQFNKANAEGLDYIDEIIAQNGTHKIDLEKYYSENIVYRFDEEMKKGMEVFMEKLGNEI
jgi:chorismate dehydratase